MESIKDIISEWTKNGYNESENNIKWDDIQHNEKYKTIDNIVRQCRKFLSDNINSISWNNIVEIISYLKEKKFIYSYIRNMFGHAFETNFITRNKYLSENEIIFNKIKDHLVYFEWNNISVDDIYYIQTITRIVKSKYINIRLYKKIIEIESTDGLNCIIRTIDKTEMDEDEETKTYHFIYFGVLNNLRISFILTDDNIDIRLYEGNDDNWHWTSYLSSFENNDELKRIFELPSKIIKCPHCN